MANTQRPNINRKVTPGSEKKRVDELDQGLRIKFEGDAFEVRFGDITPALARELRANTGQGFFGLVQGLASDPDIDLVAAFIWLARRIRGEQVALEDIDVSYTQILSGELDVEIPGAVKVGDGPEA